MFGLFGCSVAILCLTRSLPVQALNLGLFAFVFAQFGLLGHDAGHNQIFRKLRANTLFGRICGNLLLGMDLNWWRGHHNAHHGRPNQEGFDPDADIPVLAFTPEQGARRRGLFRWFSRYQSFLMPILPGWQVFDLNLRSAGFLMRRRSKRLYLASGLLIAHVVLYATILVLTQGIVHGLLFALVQRVVSGFYLATIFATNHTAMPILSASQKMDFLHQQVVTSRNIKPPRGFAFLFGGLHLQIEHHLFPTMARNQLKRVQPIVRAFCAEHGLPYRETPFLTTYGEIFRHMRGVSRTMTRLAAGSAPRPATAGS
ncbi:MAG TPA: acyl-CoA desaturase [Chloroflexota bacterium]|nr:acyl-CoA desaturase [Chloroflexota bacterium]